MADSHYVQWKTDTQEPIKMRVVDNGDGTYSLATAVTHSSLTVHNFMPDTLLVKDYTVDYQSPIFPVNGREMTVSIMLTDGILLAGLQLDVHVTWYGSNQQEAVSKHSLDLGTAPKPEGSVYTCPVLGPYASIYVANADTANDRECVGYVSIRQ